MITPNKDEQLVYAGTVALRAPNGDPLAAVPQYMIVPVDEANPNCMAELHNGERLIVAGSILSDRKSAEERFAALKAGQAQAPRADGVPIYIKEKAESINPKTGLSKGEEKAIEPIIGEMLDIFALQIRKRKALEEQR